MNTKPVNAKETEVTITELDKKEGVEIILKDEKNTPVAWYGFDSKLLISRSKIEFHANDVRIEFVGITPSMKNEMCPANSNKALG